MTARGVWGSAVVMEGSALLIPPFVFISCHDCHLKSHLDDKRIRRSSSHFLNGRQLGQSAAYGSIFLCVHKVPFRKVESAGEEKKFGAADLPS